MSDAIALNPAGAVPPASPPVQYYDLSGEHHPQQGTLLGFWLYLMSDLLIFACLFAVYGVLGRSYAAGPTGADLFALPLIAVNTAMLLPITTAHHTSPKLGKKYWVGSISFYFQSLCWVLWLQLPFLLIKTMCNALSKLKFKCNNSNTLNKYKFKLQPKAKFRLGFCILIKPFKLKQML